MADTNYDVDYNDKRFAEVETDKGKALTDLENTYAGMISDSDIYFQAQIDASKDWADKQAQIQSEQTDLAIEKIEQQKDQAKKDYLKEQAGAYADWQKQSNPYGANAEQMASAGMENTGYRESAQVSLYNTYQNRVATARESYNNAVLNYNNAIKDARLQNSSVLAEIAYNSLRQQLELSLEGFQYKNNLILDKAAKKTELENTYYSRYQDVLQQINTENALAEEVRQYNENKAMRQAQQVPLDSTSEQDSGIQSGSSSKSRSIDMDSVLALGFGPISTETLENLVRQGVVKEYIGNGRYRYRRTKSSEAFPVGKLLTSNRFLN